MLTVLSKRWKDPGAGLMRASALTGLVNFSSLHCQL